MVDFKLKPGARYPDERSKERDKRWRVDCLQEMPVVLPRNSKPTINANRKTVQVISGVTLGVGAGSSESVQVAHVMIT